MLENKYKYNDDDLIPNDFVEEFVKELEIDISNIDRISLKNKDNKEIVCGCEKLKRNLIVRLDCSKERLEIITRNSDIKDEDELL